MFPRINFQVLNSQIKVQSNPSPNWMSQNFKHIEMADKGTCNFSDNRLQQILLTGLQALLALRAEVVEIILDTIQERALRETKYLMERECSHQDKLRVLHLQT